MSFYDNSSLAFLPSSGAGKDGKAYSIKPTNGTGDFTFSRGSNLAATRVGPTGLIEKGRENLFTYSNDFSNAAWTWNGGSATGGQTDRDGGSDAYLVTRSSGGSVLGERSVSLSGVYTFSIYVKINASNGIGLAFDNTAQIARFNISDENQTTAVVSTGLIDSTQEYIGNNFYRLTISSNTTATKVRLYMLDSTGTNNDSGGGSQIIQDAQLELGLAATDYIESGATTGKAGLLEDEPRFDYSGGATCPSLLLEPSRTQLAQYSEALNIAPNVIDNANYSYNEIASPSGLIDAPKFAETTANDRHGFYQYVTTAVGAVTASVFTKQIDRRYVHFQSNLTGSALSSYVDLQDGSVVSEGTGWTLSTEDYGNGWLRISATATGVAFGAHYFIWGMSLNGTSNTYLGDGSEFTFWGFQAEQASYPTSYIPNHSGGTITRGGDATDRGANLSYTGDYTLFMEFKLTKDAVYLLNSNTSTAYSLYIENDDCYFFFGRMGGDSGLVQFVNKFDWAANLGTNIKMAIYKNGTSLKMFVNGTEYTPSANSLSTGNEVFDWRYLNYSTTTNRQEQAYIKQLLEFEEALSDADCITLTT